MKNELHILLIDDDPTVNFLNDLVIKQSKIKAKVSQSTHAAEALELIVTGEISPSLILLDLNMPEMDGWQFIDKFQKLSNEIGETKIIVLTSSINPSDKEKASKLSAIFDFYSKPLSIDKMRKIKASLVD